MESKDERMEIIGRSIGGGRVLITRIDGYETNIQETMTANDHSPDVPEWSQRCQAVWQE